MTVARWTFLFRLRLATWLVGDIRPGFFIGRVTRTDGYTQWDCGQLRDGFRLAPRGLDECAPLAEKEPEHD